MARDALQEALLISFQKRLDLMELIVRKLLDKQDNGEEEDESSSGDGELASALKKSFSMVIPSPS